MLKRLVLVICAVFAFGVVFPTVSTAIFDDEEQESKKFSTFKKYEVYFVGALSELLLRYDAEKGSAKDDFKKEITKLVTERTDKEAEFKKEKAQKLEAKIAKITKELAALKADKDSYINKEVNKYLSKKGREQLQKKKERFAKFEGRKEEHKEKNKKKKS